MGIHPKLHDELRDIVGDDALITEGDDLAYYGSDRCRGGWDVAPIAIAFPRDKGQVARVVSACARANTAIVPSGGRTGLTGAATATNGEVVVSLERMRKILEIDEAGRTVRCEAGVTVEALQQAASEVGLMYPVDFAAKGTAHIAGTIATNAGGVKVIRYGLTRDWVMGLEVVLASGELMQTGGPLVKDNTGYDLRQLFIGSEGTLGIVVEATLGLCPPPAGTVVALAGLRRDEDVLDLFRRVRRSGLILSAFECFDTGCVQRVLEHRDQDGRGPLAEPAFQHVLVEVELGPEAAVGGSADALQDAIEATRDALTLVLADAQEAGEIVDAVVASTEAQAQRLWAWREEISESLHRHRPHKADVSFPVAEVANFMKVWRERVAAALPEVPALCFGHVGDGNLHLNLLMPEGWEHDVFLERVHAFDEEVYALVRDHGGSISAEHGIGLLKRDFLGYTRSPEELALMRGIKAAFDPQNILNPGKILG